MRLHQLSVTAFGPFVDTAEVDFDALSEAGLFLLSGPTGAGKSSVLDAVCFALYGAVPGDRQHAGRLRSDQAPAELAPSVTLDLSVAGRRLRVTRSPAWDRPKKRGQGTTREQARVSLTERVGEAWVPLTSRLDEAGDLLGGLLGMSLDQFCQVALLPQGHFQAFLRADSPSRHQLLSRLFRTGRFERVEGWLREHRLALRRVSDHHAQVVTDLVSRLSEAASTALPESLGDVGASAGDGELSAWATSVRDDAERHSVALGQALGDAEQAASLAHAAWQSASATAAARDRIADAQRVVLELEAEAPAHARLEEQISLARRALSLRPLVRLADQRRTALDDLVAAGAATAAEVVSAGLDPDDLPAELERATHGLAQLAALKPVEEHLVAVRQRQEATARVLAGLDEEQGLAAAEAEAVTGLVAEAEEGVEATRVAPEAVVRAQEAVERADAVAAAHLDLARLVPEHDVVRAQHAAAVSKVLDAREHELDVRERRIAGMAGELAGALAVGDDCPVCGSADHPRPASVVRGHPDAAAERAASRALVDAQATEHAVAERLRELATAVARAREVVGETGPDESDRARAEARSALEGLLDRSARHARHVDALAKARSRADELRQAAEVRAARRRELRASLDDLTTEVARLAAAVQQAPVDLGGLDAAAARLQARRELVRRALGDVSRREAAAEALAEAEQVLSRAATDAGFAGVEEARAAELPADEVAALEARVRERLAALEAARVVLAEPDADQLLATDRPDVAGLDHQRQDAERAVEQLRAAQQHAVRIQRRVRGLSGDLTAALAAWSPVRDELAVATAVSSFADGKAPDNRLQMRLSAYVLAHRLSQVVAAANARLAQMSDRRYTVEHVAQRGAGERRGGLSLVVRDDWSGESRDPATLSGGEMFVVSLALALGLADVVAHEAGGADLQTLFVDEGFGALDAETLDDVLDILDTLRENGRAVGVVSHVAEMRDRIPTQLVVDKARTGSTVRVVG